MIIEEADFRLSPVSDSDIRFDLDLLYDIKGKNPRSEFKNVAYGVTIEHALQLVAKYRVCKKHDGESILLCTYFKEYIEEIRSLKELLRDI